MPATLIDDAVVFAARAHHGQRRKYTNLPYIGHCLEVMELVASVEHTEEMLAAAVLHDTVEDTSVCEAEIAVTFGEDVAHMVVLLSDREEGNRATRKRLATERLGAAPGEVQTIKLADLISNTRSIVARDPDFAVVYLREKRDLLAVLTNGDAALYAQAVEVLGAGENAISLHLGKPFP